MPLEMIKKIFQLSTQCERTPESSVNKKTYRSPFAALNVKLRREPVEIDAVYCNTPSMCNGSTYSLLFLGAKTLITNVYGMR